MPPATGTYCQLVGLTNRQVQDALTCPIDDADTVTRCTVRVPEDRTDDVEQRLERVFEEPNLIPRDSFRLMFEVARIVVCDEHNDSVDTFFRRLTEIANDHWEEHNAPELHADPGPGFTRVDIPTADVPTEAPPRGNTTAADTSTVPAPVPEAEDESQGPICDICYKPKENRVRLPCNHVFCYDCMVEHYGDGHVRPCPYRCNRWAWSQLRSV